MSEKGTKYFKLVRILIANNKMLFTISLLAAVIGFNFLFTITSITETIIQTKQENTVKTYGKFLMVISDIDKNVEEDIRKQDSKFTYEKFGVEGNIEYADKKITMGSMKEQMGDNLAFQIIKGKWPQASNEIVVEEYLMELFGIKNNKLPTYVTLSKGGKPVQYKVTGVISNYSYKLSIACDHTTDTNMYPSIVFEEGMLQNVKMSLVILQKELNLNAAENDINTILNHCSTDNMSINEKLISNGVNEDMTSTKTLYLILLNLLLLLEQIVMIRTILLRNKKTLFLFQALGLTPRQKRKVIFYMIQGFSWLGLILGCLLSTLTGIIYINKTFHGYSNNYNNALIHNVVIEGIIVGIILLFFYLCYGRLREASIIKGMLPDTSSTNKKYKFKKIDVCIVIMQTICLFFTMASLNFMNTFKLETKDINYDLYSKITTASYPLKEYNIAENKNAFFHFNSIDALKQYENIISLSMEAETKQSSILIEKDNLDSYFNQYCKQENVELQPKDEALWNQISKEADQYKVIPSEEIKIVVLPQKEFHQLLNQKGIQSNTIEQNKEKSCVLLLPNYIKASSNESINDNGMIQLGRIQWSKNKLEFYKETFKVEAMRSIDEEESSQILVVMNETSAKKSKLVLGYDKIRIEINPETSVSVQNEIEQKISILMSSIQGGMLNSSVSRNQQDKLMGDYTSMICNSMLIFSAVVICLYIVLNSFIDWEKYKHEYAVLRSFGMSYATLQRKLFFKYSNSIIIACILSVLIGRSAFATGTLTKQQIFISLVITISITYICRIIVYYWNKNKSISSMLNESIV